MVIPLEIKMIKYNQDVTTHRIVFLTVPHQLKSLQEPVLKDQTTEQYLKLIQEAGELSDSLCKEKDIRDDVGDMMVVLINIMVRNNLTMKECLAVAYDDIKDRKGKMIDGIFVKEGDS